MNLQEMITPMLEDYEKKYGVRLSRMEVMEMIRAGRELLICANCTGVSCKKDSQKWIQPHIQADVGGSPVISMKKCPFAHSANLFDKCVKAGVPRRYASLTFDDYEETAENSEALKAARWYIEKYPRSWLYLYGGCGTGKTFLISLLAKELISAGHKVEFADFQGVLEELKSSFDDKAVTADKVLSKYLTCEVLVLDDLGTGFFRDWGVSVLHQIINERYNAEQRTLLTSNYDFSGLSSRLALVGEYAAQRIVSRLSQECKRLYMGRTDRRGQFKKPFEPVFGKSDSDDESTAGGKTRWVRNGNRF